MPPEETAIQHREKWTPERRRQLTRDALIDAASGLFAQKGFQGASLDEIADAAGFTKGAIYSNFESKEDLLIAVLDRNADRLFSVYEKYIGRPEATAPLDSEEVVTMWAELGDRDLELNLLAQELRLLALRRPELRRRLAVHLRGQFQRLTDAGLDRSLVQIAMAASWSLWEYRAIDREHASEYEDAMRAFVEILARQVDEAADEGSHEGDGSA